MPTKEEISNFKKKADALNKGIYSDLRSYRIGLILLLVAFTIYIMISFFG